MVDLFVHHQMISKEHHHHLQRLLPLHLQLLGIHLKNNNERESSFLLLRLILRSTLKNAGGINTVEGGFVVDGG